MKSPIDTKPPAPKSSEPVRRTNDVRNPKGQFTKNPRTRV